MEPAVSVNALLRPGEQVLWLGQPTQRLFALRWLDVVAIPVGVVWFGLTVWWNLLLLSFGPPLGFLVFNLPVLAFIAYFLLGRFLHNWILRRRTRYLVTNHRALVIRGTRSPRVSEQSLIRMFHLESKVKPDSSGTIWFDRGERPLSGLGYHHLRLLYSAGLDGMQFFRIPDAGPVLELIRQCTIRGTNDPAAALHDIPGWVRPRLAEPAS